MNKDYKPHRKIDKYEAELNRLASKCGSLRTFTDEENIQINKDLSEGLDDFLSKERIREFESACELSKIILTD